MSVVVGLLLGLGLVLTLSPVLWPAGFGAGGRSPSRRLRERLVQAGLGGVHPAVLAMLCLLGGIAAGAVVAALLPVPALAIAAGVAGAGLPVAIILGRARARRRAARLIWPDVVEHLLSAVRAGLPLGDALAELGETGPRQLREAAATAARDLAVSGDLGGALDDLKERLADPVADRILETLRMAHEVGGTELPSVLRALAADLRRDAALRAEVESRQSWVRTAARLGVAAPWIVLVLLSTRPEAMRAYDSPLGLALILGGGAVSLVAYRIMIAIGRLPEERRWFA